jgi:hypothetical protein
MQARVFREQRPMIVEPEEQGCEAEFYRQGTLLWRASDDPANHRLFIDFTIWATAAHGLVMIVATPMQKGASMMVVESLPLLVIAAVLRWLRPPRAVSMRRSNPCSSSLRLR